MTQDKQSLLMGKLLKALANVSLVSFFALGLLCGIEALAGSFWGDYYPCDLFSHFKLQFLAVSIWCAVLSLGRAKKLVPVFIGFALLSAVPLAVRYLPATSSVSNAAVERAARLKVLTANLQSVADVAPESFAAYVEKVNPDIISLQELGDFQATYFQQKFSQFPHRYLLPVAGPSCDGVGIMSKYPILRSETCRFGLNAPAINCDVTTPAGVVKVIVAHPWPPNCESFWLQELLWVDGVAGIVKATKYPVIVAGDINSTVWGKVFRKLQAIGLVDTSLGYGIQPTWPVNFALAGIAIDHVLVSKHFAVRAHERGPNVGSDHFPLMVEVDLPTDGTDTAHVGD